MLLPKVGLASSRRWRFPFWPQRTPYQDILNYFKLIIYLSPWPIGVFLRKPRRPFLAFGALAKCMMRPTRSMAPSSIRLSANLLGRGTGPVAQASRLWKTWPPSQDINPAARSPGGRYRRRSGPGGPGSGALFPAAGGWPPRSGGWRSG